MADVLVVGGRTTGLMMASELARRQVSVRIIDKSPGIDPHVRANLLHSRTLEIFQGLGLDEEATQGSFPEHGIRIYANGQSVGAIDHEPIDSPFPFGLSQSQAHTEAVLEQHLHSMGVAVERSVELVGLTQLDDRVRATLRHADGRREELETSWLIGCDGAHSTVRHACGCDFPGDRDVYPYALADVVLEGDLALDHSHLFLHDEGDLFIFSALPEGRRLISANLNEGQIGSDTPTLEQIQDIVSRRGRDDLKLSDPRWLTCFNIHYRLVPHYRFGRVFLAGDAAHVHSPVRGQGMNTGIQDAFNLGWKLAQVIAGLAPEHWLDSYEAERRSVGEEVVRMTRAATESLEAFAHLSASERERLIARMVLPDQEKLQAARHLQEVDLDYRSSALSLEPEEEFSGGPHAGEQAPDASPLVINNRPTSWYRFPIGTKHRLLLFSGSGSDGLPEALLQAAGRHLSDHGPWLEVFVVAAGVASAQEGGSAKLPAEIAMINDVEGSFHARYNAESESLYLIRPDGYVTYRSRSIQSLEPYLRHVL